MLLLVLITDSIGSFLVWEVDLLVCLETEENSAALKVVVISIKYVESLTWNL